MNIDRLLAQVVPPINPGDLPGRPAFNDPEDVIVEALKTFIIPILTGVAILFVVWSGYQYLTSGGDPAKAEKARANLTYAIIGVILTVLSYALVTGLGNIIQRAAGG